MSDGLHLCRAIRNNEVTSVRIPSNVQPHQLAAALQVNTTLQQLVLSGNDSYSLADFCLVLEALSNVTSLKTLDLSKMDLDDGFLVHVVEFVASSPSLMRLDLSFNLFEAETAWDLGEALKNHPTMQAVVLEQVGLENQGFKALLEALTPSGCRLVKLNVAHNDLTMEVGEFMREFCAANETLQLVNLNGNFINNEIAGVLRKSQAANRERAGGPVAAVAAAESIAAATGEPAGRYKSSLDYLMHVEDDAGKPSATPEIQQLFPSLMFLQDILSSEGYTQQPNM